MNIIQLNSILAKVKFTDKERADGIPRAIHEHFKVFVENYQFMKPYKQGGWDGTISFFNKIHSTIPLGLIPDLEEYIFDEFPDCDIEGYSKQVDDFWLDKELNQLPCKDYVYYDDQYEIIKECLRHKTGVIESATGSGKSIMTAGILYNLMKEKKIKKDIIIVVPSISLVSQLYHDMIDYGFPVHYVGRVGGKYREYDKEIIITTWQSLGSPFMKRKKGAKPLDEKKKEMRKFLLDRMKNCKVGIFDEAHLTKASVLTKIIETMVGVEYKIGMTGTLPSDTTSRWTIFGNIGEFIAENGTTDLIKQGRLADLKISVYNINYPAKYKKKIKLKEYNDLVEYIISCPVRQNLISNVVKPLKTPTLLLVNRRKHGETMFTFLKNKYPDKKIFYVDGNTPVDKRDEVFEFMRNNNNTILISTVKLLSMGINIKSLENLIFGHIGKAEIAVFQSIGRVLRKNGLKKANIIDIGSNLKWDKAHTNKRLKYYENKLPNKFKVIQLGKK